MDSLLHEKVKSGGRFTDSEITQELISLAARWLRTYDGGFPFLNSVRESMLQNGRLTVPMARGVLNCMLTIRDEATPQEVAYCVADEVEEVIYNDACNATDSSGNTSDSAQAVRIVSRDDVPVDTAWAEIMSITDPRERGRAADDYLAQKQARLDIMMFEGVPGKRAQQYLRDARARMAMNIVGR